MAHPFESFVMPGYVIDVEYNDDCPPGKFLSPEYGYYDGYYRIVVTVTQDNLSVVEQVREVFFVRPTCKPEEHGTRKFGETMVMSLGVEQKILHIVTGCKQLDLGQGLTDFDLVFFLLSTAQEDDYGSAWIFFRHDKEEQLESLLG